MTISHSTLIGYLTLLLLSNVITGYVLCRIFQISLRKVAHVSNLLAKLSLSEAADVVEATPTKKSDLKKSRKPDQHFIRKATLASGAEWLRDPQGNWHLLSTNNVEVETAIFELIYSLNPVTSIPGFDDFVDECAYIGRLTSLFEMGLPLPVEQLKESGKTKAGEK